MNIPAETSITAVVELVGAVTSGAAVQVERDLGNAVGTTNVWTVPVYGKVCVPVDPATLATKKFTDLTVSVLLALSREYQ